MTVINGTQDEILDLMLFIEKYCACHDLKEKFTCPTHLMLHMPQKQMDALVFYRRYWEKKGLIDR